MKDNLKILFMGTPDIATNTLKELIDSKIYKPSLVVTQKDKLVGRKRELTPPPVKILAERNDIEVFQPENLKEQESIKKIKSISPDIIIVIAYGKIIPKEIIDIPKFGVLNIHASLLPKYRGASPIQSAILEGEKLSGVTIMKIDEKLDHGPILAQKKIVLNQGETSESLFEKMSELGPELLLEILPKWLAGKVILKEQDHKNATFTKVLSREDGNITKEKTAEEIDRMFRALYPWPGVYMIFKTKDRKDLKLKITKLSIVKCDTVSSVKLYLNKEKQLILRIENGCLWLKEVQPESKNKMSGEAFWQGYKNNL
jgi:methionyl-tRNA formyltransferase